MAVKVVNYLDQLLYDVTLHYRDRGFPESALLHLRWMILTNICNGKVTFNTAYPGCDKPIIDLLNRYPRCPLPATPYNPSIVDAVFGFAFGYRMTTWPADPTAPNAVLAYRIPGANNAVLAEQARTLQLTHGWDLYLQPEIADVIGITSMSSRIDQSTFDVAQEFVNKAKKNGKTINSVVVVAHRHHFDRCRIILENEWSMAGLPTTDQYSLYDPMEAQPRVMSPEEYIVNDFASIAGMP